MGVWGKIGHNLAQAGLNIAGSFVGDPMLGSQVLSNAGQVAGNDAAAAAQGRAQQAQIQDQHDRNALDFYHSGMDRAINAPRQLASNAARGDLLAHVQPVSFSGLPSYVKMPQISGGLTPAALGPESRAAGNALTRSAMLNLLNSKFNLPDMPTQTPLPQASGYDTFSKILGRTGAYAGAAAPFLDRLGHRPPQMTKKTPGQLPPIGNPSLPTFTGWGG